VGLPRHLVDRWGLLAGAIAGVLTAALALAAGAGPSGLALGAVVAVVVYGLKAGAGALARRHAPTPDEQLPMPAKGSPAEVWLRRAERAVRTLRDQTAAAPVAMGGQVADVGEDAARTLQELRRVAAQVAAVEDAAGRLDVTRLQAERTRLVQAVFGESEGSARKERERAAAAVADQLAAYGRMQTVRDELVARMEATALGLDGLVARLAEVLALAATAGGVDTTADRISELTGSLDGLRAGLVETEALSRQVLGRRGPACA
jgi:hypothetical protein